MKKNLVLSLSVIGMFLLLGASCTVTTPFTGTIKKEEPKPIVSNQEKKTIPEPTVTTTNEPTITPKTDTPSPALVDCGSKLDCFNQRATTCQKTKFLHIYTEEPETTPGIVTSFSTFYEITGPSNGKCQFYHGQALMKITANAAGKQLAMKADGKTLAEVEAELAQLNKQFADNAALIKTKLYCNANAGTDISDHLQRIFKGQQKISVIDGITKYGTNITCVER